MKISKKIIIWMLALTPIIVGVIHVVNKLTNGKKPIQLGYSTQYRGTKLIRFNGIIILNEQIIDIPLFCSLN